MFLGDKVEVRLRIAKTSLVAYMPNTFIPSIGQELYIKIPPENTIIIPKETTEAEKV